MAVQGGEGEGQKEKAAAGRRAGGGGVWWGHTRCCGGGGGMHPAQMEALRAMCGALIPSLPAEEAAHGAGDCGRDDPRPGGKDLERFYLAFAADSTIPDELYEDDTCLCILDVKPLSPGRLRNDATGLVQWGMLKVKRR